MLAGTFCRLAIADESQLDQFKVKAAFVYNFSKFVEWPPANFADPGSPIIIGVPPRCPVFLEIGKVVAGRLANGRPLVIRACETLGDAKGVHILFIPASEESWLAQDLPGMAAAGILTVGESDLFAGEGGIITFVVEGSKLRFKVTLFERPGSPAKLSSQLLKLAISVRRREGG